jgi:hypothetical protein
MRYAVKTKFVFSATFFIEAENREQAKEYAAKHCGLVIGGKIHSSLPTTQVDCSFDVHPDTVIGRAYLTGSR